MSSPIVRTLWAAPIPAALLVALAALAPRAAAQTEVDRIAPPELDGSESFACDVAVSGDALVVGALHTGDAGAAWVYRLVAGEWTFEALIEPTGATSAAHFGSEVAISGDTIVVGAPEDGAIASGGGGAYVFERIGGTWVQTAQLVGSELDSGDRFGVSVGIDGDGDTIVVGAEADEWDPALGQKFFNLTGAAYVFERSGGSWVETSRLKDPFGGYGSDYFGGSVAVDDEVFAIGAINSFNPQVALNSGAIWIFDYGPGGNGSQWILPPGNPYDFHLGSSVAVSDGRVLAASLDGGPGPGFLTWTTGVVYVYERQGGQWVETAQLAPTEDVTVDGHWFGRSLAIDGDRALVGARQPDGTEVVHVYDFLVGAGWVETARLVPSAATPGEGVGGSVALSGSTAVTGSLFADDVATDGGAATVFDVGDACCPSLIGAPTFVELFSGGLHTLHLDAGPSHEGDLYLVVGSLSGSEPGLPIDGVHLPLNVDSYTFTTLQLAGSPLFPATVGTLGPDGLATAGFQVPPLMDVDLVGLEFRHAFLAFDVDGAFAATFASDVAPMLIVM